jgi:hypothetical protein
MWGRLVGMESVRIGRLLERAKQQKGYAWLRPIRPCFNSPGSGEVRTLVGLTGWVNGVAISADGRLALSE